MPFLERGCQRDGKQQKRCKVLKSCPVRQQVSVTPLSLKVQGDLRTTGVCEEWTRYWILALLRIGYGSFAFLTSSIDAIEHANISRLSVRTQNSCWGRIKTL
jgi:hypothetical protein